MYPTGPTIRTSADCDPGNWNGPLHGPRVPTALFTYGVASSYLSRTLGGETRADLSPETALCIAPAQRNERAPQRLTAERRGMPEPAEQRAPLRLADHGPQRAWLGVGLE